MQIKNKLIKWALSVALLFSLANKANSGILYSENQIKQNINLEQITNKINQKYPKKQLEYFSKGFLQFKDNEIIKDSEINNLIQKLNNKPNKTIDGVNFYNDYYIMIDSEPHHIGDGRKDWFPIKKNPEATNYEKKFILENPKNIKNPKLALETFSSDSDNKIYLNRKQIGILPKISKKQWGDLMKKYKKRAPFLYKEFDVSKYLKTGENIIKVESEKPRGFFKTYDDFIIRRIQIIYSEVKNEQQKK